MNGNAAMLAEALAWVGTPYRHQACRKGVGADCLGLVRGAWRIVYRAEPELPGPYAPDWAEAGGGDPLLEAARRHCRWREPGDPAIGPGQLIVFRWRADMAAKHCGIAVDGARFVHAYQGHGVLVSALVPQWRRRIAGTFDFPDF